MAGAPVLVVISGPAGAGKTTLAHALARAVGCPAICRDEIKEGMVHAAGDFAAGPGDELTRRTLPVFFGVLEVLLRAGVTTVAEAAFQDRVWRQGLEPLRGLARVRIVHCRVDADVAFGRRLRRAAENPLRRAHADPRPGDAQAQSRRHEAFDRLSLEVPSMAVDTTDGYLPALSEIVAFVGRAGPA
jgi:predicted kinase